VSGLTANPPSANPPSADRPTASDPPGSEFSALGFSSADMARAARILAIRTRREASGIFAGSYASAFRGGGMEFEESRPYVAGDDVRSLDWNAMARTGEPFVKHFREERDLSLLLALDVSASMRFRSATRSKAAAAAHAAALLAAAAGQAGDQVGLVAFDEAIRQQIPAARGPLHTWRVIQAAATCGETPRSGTRLDVVFDDLLSHSRHRSVAVVLSDFRDPSLLVANAGAGSSSTQARLVALGRGHDLVSVVLYDPREETLPRAGLLRLVDPERPGRTLLLNSSKERTRTRYARACRARRRTLDRLLRGAGSDVLWLRTDRDPLRALMHFFRQRASQSRARP